MERNKKNKKNQTFEVYPYLSQYQYLMRTGGQLPWYQDGGQPEKPDTTKMSEEDAAAALAQYEVKLREWQKANPITFTGDHPFKDLSGPCDEKLQAECNERGGTWQKKTINKTGQIPKDTCECEEPENKTVDEKVDETVDEKVEDKTGDCPKEIYIQCGQKGLSVNEKTCTCLEKTEEEDNNSTEEQKKKALEDYQNGIISKKELDEIVGIRHNLGRGLRKGTPNYEITPTSPLGLLATAVDSTYGAIKGTGRRSINPKTGLPYTKADFKKTSVDMGKVSNVNNNELYWDDANKADYMKQLNSGVKNPINPKTGKPYTQVDLLGSKNQHLSNRYEQFKIERDKMVDGFGPDFNPEGERIYSDFSYDPVTGEKVFADVTTDVEDKEKNPAYIEAIQKIPFNEKLEGHPSLENIPEYLTRQVTEKYDPNIHETEFDKAEEHLKDINVGAITVGKNLDVKGMIIDTNDKNLEENIKNPTTGETFNNVGYVPYNPEEKYTNETITTTSNDQNVKNETKLAAEKAAAEKAAAEEAAAAEAAEGKIGLEMFVYGGHLPKFQSTGSVSSYGNNTVPYDQASWLAKANYGFSEALYNKRTTHGTAPASGIINKMDKTWDATKYAADYIKNKWFENGGQKELDQYQKKGEKKKVHDFLEYFTGFPRTGFVPYNGDFTAQQLQSAITRDSTSIENELANNWFLRNFIGQDQTHQSNTGTSGKLQLNREWLHKLLEQSDKSRAKQLNFYRQGGSLPWYEDTGSVEKANDSPSFIPSFSEWVQEDPIRRGGPNAQAEYDKLYPTVNPTVVDPTVNPTVVDPTVNPTVVDPAKDPLTCDENNPDCIPGNPDGKINPKTGFPYTTEEMAKVNDQEMKDSQQDMSKSGIIDQSYGKGMQGVSNAIKAATKTGLVDRTLNTYGDYGKAAYDWANFGEALTSNWQNQAAKTKADTENTTGQDQFMAQGTSQGISDPNSGDTNTNQKVDEIYSGNTMKAPLIMSQMGGQGMAQPVAQNVNYAALAEFTGVNPYNTEISYSPEVIAYQKQIMGKMARGGQLPMAQFGWIDKAKSAASGVYNKAKNLYNNSSTNVKNVINTTKDLVTTGIEEGIQNRISPILGSTATATLGVGAAASELLKGNFNLHNTIANNSNKNPNEIKENVDTMYKGVYGQGFYGSGKKRGGEQTSKEKVVDIDYEILQELIKAGADIEII